MRPVRHKSDQPIGTEDCLVCKVVRMTRGQRLVYAYLILMATVSVLLILVLLGKL